MPKSFVTLADRSIKCSNEIIGWRGIGINFKRAEVFRLGASEVPIEDPLRFGQIDVSFSFAIIDVNRIHRGVTHLRIRFERLDISVRQPQPRFRNARPGTRESRIFLECTLEELQALPQRLLGAFVRIKQTPQIIIVCLRAPRQRRRGYCQLEFESIDDGACDLILQGENSMHFALVRLRPDGKSRACID